MSKKTKQKNAQKQLRDLKKVHSTVWHTNSFLPKLKCKKQSINKEPLLPNAEYIIVLLSLPFTFMGSCEGDSTETQVTYTLLPTLDSHLRKQTYPLISTGITGFKRDDK